MCQSIWTTKDLRKRLVCLAIFLIILGAFFCVAIPASNAAYKDLNYDEYIDYLQNHVSPDIFLSFTQTAAEIMFYNRETLLFNVNEPGNPAMDAFNVMTGFTATLIVIYLFISVLKEAIHGRANMELFLRVFIRMAVTLFLLLNLNTITTGIHTIMGGFVRRMVDALNQIDAASSAAVINQYWDMEISNLFEGILKVLALALVWLVMHIVRILLGIPMLILSGLLYFRSYSLIIELAVRKTFMPLSVLSFLEPGQSRIGMRYLKRYIAVYIKMLMFVVALAVGEIVAYRTVTVDENFQNNVYGSDVWGVCARLLLLLINWVAIEIAAYTMAARGAKLADDIVGA